MIHRAVSSRSPQERLSLAARSIQPSGIRRFFDIASQMVGVITLGVGEPDLGLLPAARDVAAAAIQAGNTRYTSNNGLVALRHLISAYLQARLGVTYCPETEVLVTNGVAQGIDLACRTVVNPGDEVLVPEPCFVSYRPCVELVGGRSVPIPLRAVDGFKLTPGQLEAHVTEKTRVLILSYPNNPTGATMTHEELMHLLPVIRKYDLTVISDEVYSELTYTGAHKSIASLPGMRERTILLNGFSKTFSMTGWRLGFATGPQGLIEAMTRIHQHALMCAPTVAQVAAITALERVDEVAETARQVFDARRRLIHTGLQNLGLTCLEPQGAFYAFPSVASTGLDGDQFAHLLLHEERVAVVPGSAFGESGRDHVRLSYAASEEKLQGALERMARFMNHHRMF